MKISLKLLDWILILLFVPIGLYNLFVTGYYVPRGIFYTGAMLFGLFYIVVQAYSNHRLWAGPRAGIFVAVLGVFPNLFKGDLFSLLYWVAAGVTVGLVISIAVRFAQKREPAASVDSSTPAQDKPNTLAAAMEPSKHSQIQWHYAAAGGQRGGPIDEAELCRLIAAGWLKPDDLVWNRLMGNEWRQISKVGKHFSNEPAATNCTPSSIIPKQNPLIVVVCGWICLAVAIGFLMFLFSVKESPSLSAPFFLIVFLMGIAAAIKRRIVNGLLLALAAGSILCFLLIPGVAKLALSAIESSQMEDDSSLSPGYGNEAASDVVQPTIQKGTSSFGQDANQGLCDPQRRFAVKMPAENERLFSRKDEGSSWIIGEICALKFIPQGETALYLDGAKTKTLRLVTARDIRQGEIYAAFISLDTNMAVTMTKDFESQQPMIAIVCESAQISGTNLSE